MRQSFVSQGIEVIAIKWRRWAGLCWAKGMGQSNQSCEEEDVAVWLVEGCEGGVLGCGVRGVPGGDKRQSQPIKDKIPAHPKADYPGGLAECKA